MIRQAEDFRRGTARCAKRTGRRLVLALLAVCLSASLAQGTAAAEVVPPFEISSFSGGFATAAGAPYNQAGGHPFTAAGAVKFNYHVNSAEQARTNADPKNFHIVLPPGLVGNPLAATRCPQSEFGPEGLSEPRCPVTSQIGTLATDLTFYLTPEPLRFPTRPLYNLVPPKGVAAEFGVKVAAGVNAHVEASVGPGPDFPIVLDVRNVSQAVGVTGADLELWGVPADSRHDSQRNCQQNVNEFCSSQAPPRPFITLPTSCAGPQATSIEVETWQGDSRSASFFNKDASTPPNPLGQEGCSRLAFSPTVSIQPTSSQADSPTGLQVDLKIPQSESVEGLAEANLKDAIVSLPEGLSINPSSANGLGACSPQQIALANTAPASCPDSSRLGTVEVKTPLIDHPLNGSVFLAQQKENKFGSLLAIYLAIEDPDSGVVIKLPGRIETSSSGRVVARVEEAPQLPFEELDIQFFGGPRSALRTPEACGSYESQATFIPWSGTDPVNLSSSFSITEGPGGSACPSGAFSPSLEAGTANASAGRYSPFLLRLSRSDGTQQLREFNVQLPSGLLGRLAGIPYCSDAALAGVSEDEGTGAAQLSSPSCSAASQVGTVSVGAGAGSNPFYVDTGKVYLAGPYKGAPLSLAIVTPAIAGPFDLGSVVVRTALKVDPSNAQVTAYSDPLPTVLHGIPLDLRDVRVSISREEFILNPTNCEPMQFLGTATGTGGGSAALSQRFQVGDCSSLGFQPKLSLTLSGATGRAKNPALKAVLTQPANQANLSRIAVALPKWEFIDNRHINNPCTRVQFNAGSGNGNECPAKSILGYARAYTPLLAKPLEGPVYFRSNGGERKLPDLVASLSGQIHVNLVGYVDSIHHKGSSASRTRVTFALVPDAPVSRFMLQLKGGSKGLLQNSVNLCKVKNVAQVTALGQNGARQELEPVIARKCAHSQKNQSPKAKRE